MDTNFDKTKFKEYFHYGLDYKNEDIFDAVIMESISKVNKINFSSNEIDKIGLIIDMAENLYVQFFRFVELAADESKNWYQSVKKDDIEESIENRIDYLKENDLLSVVSYIPMRGIYITDRDAESNRLGITGQQHYQRIPCWIRNEIIPILYYLSSLENTNPYQYTSLFLDTKYARSENCNNTKNMSKVKSLYESFLENVKPAKSDIYRFLGKNISNGVYNYIDNNFPDYWTITDLKESSENEKYFSKVKSQCKEIKFKFMNDVLELV